jgi:hypothetical protein
MSQIKIYRPWSYFGLVRALEVNIDGVNVGKVGSRKTAEFNIESGKHTIQVSMDWCKSVPLTFNVSDNANISFEVKVSFMPLALLFCFFRPSKVFSLVNV